MAKTSSPKAGKKAGPAMTPGGSTPAELVRKSNVWRDSYNPLRGLVVSKVVALIEQAERGDFAELQLLNRKVERRFPILKALKKRRLTALTELDWDIKTVSKLPTGATQEQADAQAKFLQERYNLISNLREAIDFLEVAEFRGYSILQKHRYVGGEHDGAVRELHWLPQWNWCRDGSFGDWFYNKNAQFGIAQLNCQAILGEDNRIGSEMLPREDFIIREADPLYEITLFAFVNWSMGRKDFAAFVEIFGLPNGVAIMPPNIPLEKQDEYRVAAEKVANGVSGALPNGSDIKFPTASVRGDAPFKGFCDAQNEDVVLAGTGGLLSMLTAPTGIGKGPSDEHGDAFKVVACASAKTISEVLNRDFDVQELAEAFPGQPVLAYFELADTDEEDATAVATRIVALDGIGLETEAEEASEKTGLKLTRRERPTNPNDPNNPQPGDQVPPPGNDKVPPAIKNRRIRNDEKANLAQAVASDLQPLLTALDERLQRIVGITDPTLRLQKFQELWAELEPLQKDIAADPRTAQLLQEQGAKALAAGLKGATP